MVTEPIFPTSFHQNAAEAAHDYFQAIGEIDTVLVVNSCARGQAVPESDLDMAILVKPAITADKIKNMEADWLAFSALEPMMLNYKKTSRFAHLHVDLITGNYLPGIIEPGEPIDYFEIEIGNQICYSAPMGLIGPRFQELQKNWLPYYNEELRSERFARAVNAVNYDLEHIPYFINRGLYFQAFDILRKAFKKYLQALFITNRTYPIAYDKWIKEQVVKWLGKPDLYTKLPPILSITDIESSEINIKAEMLAGLLNDLEFKEFRGR